MNIFTTILTEPLANGLVLFYNILGHNMGLAVIGFTLALVTALSPLTKPYMESMRKMREHQDELNKLKVKHKDDKIKFAQAQNDFFKEKGIKNPTAGCIPYILQIVVLIGLFRLFINAFNGDSSIADNFNTLLYEPLQFSAGEVVNTKFLYLDLAKPDSLNIGLPFAFPGPLLFLAAFVQLLSAKITQPFIEEEKKAAKKTPESTDDIMANTQSYMIVMLPVMTLWFGLQFPSALALYWFIFSAQQAYKQYRSAGWGGLTPWLVKVNLLELPSKIDQNGQNRKRRQRANR